MNRISYLLIISLLVFFCRCDGSKTNNTNNETKKTEAQDTTQGKQSKSQDLSIGDNSSQDSPEGRIKNIIQEYFALYGKNNWDALAGFYAPKIAQFITIKNTTPAQVTASAKNFFKNKSNIAYKPDMSTFKILEAQMQWNVSIELDMQWDNQKSRVQLDLAFLDPGYKIVSYKESKVLSSKQKTGEMSLEELFMSIPLEKRSFVQQADPVNLSNDPQMLKYTFMYKSYTHEHYIKALNWQNRTILAVVASLQMPTSGTQMSKKFSGGTSIFFLEKTAQGWQQALKLISESALKEIVNFFEYKDVTSTPLAVASFQDNDITITHGNKKMNIGWDAGTYRIVSREETPH